MTDPTNPTPEPQSTHVHAQRYDGDDPYLICECGARWDAISGRPLNVAAGADYPEPQSTAFRKRLEADIISAARIDPPFLVDVLSRIQPTLDAARQPADPSPMGRQPAPGSSLDDPFRAASPSPQPDPVGQMPVGWFEAQMKSSFEDGRASRPDPVGLREALAEAWLAGHNAYVREDAEVAAERYAAKALAALPVHEDEPTPGPTVEPGHNHTTEGLPTYPVCRGACPLGCDKPLPPTERVEVRPGEFLPRPRMAILDPFAEGEAIIAVKAAEAKK